MMTEDRLPGQDTSDETETQGSHLSDIQDLMGEIVEGVRAFAPKTAVKFPRYDFRDTSDAYLLQFDLPGLRRDELSINTEGDQVIISGDRIQQVMDPGEHMRKVERPFGPFRRAVNAPTDVDLDGIRARLADGVLTVTLPKRADRSARKVDIDS
jgi:HSP20 family protein